MLLRIAKSPQGFKEAFMVPQYLDYLANILMSGKDIDMKSSLLELLLALLCVQSSTACDMDAIKEHILKGGLLKPILLHLDLAQYSVQLVLRAAKLVEVLAHESASRATRMLFEGAAGTIMTCLFSDVSRLMALEEAKRDLVFKQRRSESMSPVSSAKVPRKSRTSQSNTPQHGQTFTVPLSLLLFGSLIPFPL